MNDDTLILYYYNDGLTDEERRQVETALAADSELAARFDALGKDLEAAAELEPVELPPHVRQRMHDSIDRIARPVLVNPQKPARTVSFLSFAWGAAITAALAVGIGIGVFLSAPDVMPVAGSGDPFTRGMQVYLQDARREISAMPADATADRTRLIMHIVDQNRLFERAAEQNDSQNLARVLRAFEPILLQLAAEDIAPEDAEALRAQLSFELNVMLTKMARDTSKETHST
jgi:hypothetical protein